MIIDFHTHIFPKTIRDNRANYLSGEPAFKILYESRNSKIIGATEIVASMDEQGVDRSVVFGFPWKNADTFQKHNDYIMEATARYPKRLIGFGCLDPFSKKAVKETERCLEQGLAGIGELAFYQSGIDEESMNKLAPIMELCLNKSVPVLIHTNEPVGHMYPGKTPNTLLQIYRLVKRFPDNKIVLAHWGGGLFFFHLMKKEVKETFKKVYFDTAASPFLYDSGIYRIAAEIVGVEKIIFGSDFPLLPPKRYFKELEEEGLSHEAIESICGKNASKLLKSQGT